MQRTHFPNWGWSYGDIGNYGIQVAPYSKLAAAYPPNSDDDLRVYAQKTDDTALPGTSITMTRFEHVGGPAICVYIQAPNHDIVQKCHNTGKGWSDMDQVIASNAPFRTSFAVTDFRYNGSSDVNLRLYWAASNEFWQWCWNTDGFRDKRKMEGATLAGSQIAAIAWDGTPDLRVYYQGGNRTDGAGSRSGGMGRGQRRVLGRRGRWLCLRLRGTCLYEVTV
ncbi:fungal fucose-specific lectin-domain-containing protein [Aspergillus multicolor]|uniref:fungal fucose-specific lectin-domain-containing protein n=1 Tax=Aspergillus multicolor TaxID=41759 RepID=UPI003CCD37C2